MEIEMGDKNINNKQRKRLIIIGIIVSIIIIIIIVAFVMILAIKNKNNNSTNTNTSNNVVNSSTSVSKSENFSNNKIVSYDSTDLSGNSKKMKISVRPEFDNRIDAANLLASINNDMVTLIHHLKTSFVLSRDYNKYSSKTKELINGLRRDTELSKKDITKIIRNLDRYGSNTIEENYPSEKSTSVTIDKGHKMKFCVRSMKDGSLVDRNTMTFVFLHELSHIGCTSVSAQSHNREFWTTFHFILLIACELGIYNPINYSKNPVYYCSMFITYNPLFDDKN